MQIDPLLASLTPTSTLPSRAVAEGGDSPTFAETLAAVMAGLDQASSGTVDAMWTLQSHMLSPFEGWYQHQAIPDLPAAITKRDVLLFDFTKAMRGVLQDYGVSTDSEIRMTVGLDGKVHVDADRPDGAMIESLINGSAVLQGAATRLLADTHRITMATLAERGQVTDAMSDDLRNSLMLVLSRTEHDVVGEVRANGAVLATSEQNSDWMGLLANLDRANDAFDEAERQRRIEYEQAMAQWRREDEVRRVDLQMAKEDALADKLSERVAAERRERLHPEQGHTPVFI